MDPDDPSDREPAPLQVDAWAQIYLEERPVLELARELRPVAELLKVPSDLDSPYATAIRGLLRLGPPAWSAVEGGEVSPYGAATIGNDLADEANTAARADRQMMMIADLARHERVGLGAVASQPGAEHGRDHAGCEVYAANDVALGIGDIEPPATIGEPLGPRELRQAGGSAIARIALLSGAGQMMDSPRFRCDAVDGVAFAQCEIKIAVAIETHRPRSVQRRRLHRRAVGRR
jgi:hypothetical protein